MESSPKLFRAVTLSKSICFLLSTLEQSPFEINYLTDSKVVLAWLQKLTSNWKTFIANRVSQIVYSLLQAIWRYVKSANNPADLATAWLPDPTIDYSSKSKAYFTELEKKGNDKILTFVTQASSDFESDFKQFSNIQRLICSFAFIYR